MQTSNTTALDQPIEGVYADLTRPLNKIKQMITFIGTNKGMKTW